MFELLNFRLGLDQLEHLPDHELRVTQFNYTMLNFLRNNVKYEIQSLFIWRL